MKFFTSASLFIAAIATTFTVVVADRPADGKYYLVNKASRSGQQLAITFNGKGNVLTVTPLSKAATQEWTLKTYDANTQSISPGSDSTLQAAWGNNVIDVRDAGSYVWKISSDADGSAIQDGGATVYWGIADAKADAQVTIGKSDGTTDQRWTFTAVTADTSSNQQAEKPKCLAFGATCSGTATPCCDNADGTKVQCLYQDTLMVTQKCGCRTDKTICGGTSKDGKPQPPCCPA